MMTVLLAAATSLQIAAAPAVQRDTVPIDTAAVDPGPRRGPSGFGRETTAAPADTTTAHHRAVEYSDWYARRLTIHRYGSYAMLPLFGAEYVLGQRLMNGNAAPGTRGTHAAVAAGVGALFTINTVTGLWNLWDSRHDDAGRSRRLLHSGLMLAADAGFTATGVIGRQARNSQANANLHRNVGIGSMAAAGAGTLLMWLWKD